MFAATINMLGSIVGTLGAIPCCICCPNPYKPVAQGNVGLVTRFGRFARAVDPGLVKINPLSESLIQVDVKIQIVGTYTHRREDCAFVRASEQALTLAPAQQRFPDRCA